jgi:Protein  of unknown function (DUF3018)
MALSLDRKPLRVKAREHRERVRALALRPLENWAPDVRSPAFRAEARRQSLAIARSPQVHDDQAFIDAVSAIKFE